MKRLFAVICLLCLAFGVYAASVSILVCQNDNTQNEIRNMSNLFEEQVMDYLFDKGHIVSDGTIIIKNNEMTGYQSAIDASLTGFFDYLVYIQVNYSDIPSMNPSGILMTDLSFVEWEVLRISDSKVVRSGVEKPKVKTGEKEESGLLKFSNQIAMLVEQSLLSTNL